MTITVTPSLEIQKKRLLLFKSLRAQQKEATLSYS
jgi:hypothetical protein